MLPDVGPDWLTCAASHVSLGIFVIVLVAGLVVSAAVIGLAISKKRGAQEGFPNAFKLLIGVWAASLVVVVACTLHGFFGGLNASCIAAAATSLSLVPLVASSALLALLLTGRLALDAVLLRGHSAGECFACFFAVWWAAGVTVLTCFGPFTRTSNAYFACWAAFVFSCAMLFETTGSSASARSIARGEQRAFYGILVASAALFGACVPRLADSGEAVYALVGAILSALTVGAILLRGPRIPPAWRTVLVILLCLMWATLVWFCTFSGPFGVTGNGYFSAWLGGGCALLALLLEAKRAEADSSVAQVRAALSRHLLALLGVASLVVCIGAAGGRHGLPLYALVVGGVSLALVCTVFLHRTVKRDEASSLASAVSCTARGVAYTNHILLALFLTVWWAVGAAVITFAGPFTTSSNAYFATWGALLCAWAMLIEALRPAAELADEAAAIATGSRRAHLIVLLSTAVLLAACVAVRANGSGTLWALITCLLSAGILMVLLYAQAAQPAARSGLKVILLVIWASVVGGSTFAGAFVITGNGYFACWGGLVGSAMLVMDDDGALRLLSCGKLHAADAPPRAAHHERQSLTMASAAEGEPTPDSTSGGAPAHAGFAGVDEVSAAAAMVTVHLDEAADVPARPADEPMAESVIITSGDDLEQGPSEPREIVLEDEVYVRDDDL